MTKDDTPFTFEIVDDTTPGSGDPGNGGGGEVQASNRPPAADKTSALEAQLADMGRTLKQVQTSNAENQQRAQLADAERKITDALAASKQTVDDAESKLATALEDGDGLAIANAQRILSQAAAKHDRMEAEAEGVRKRLKGSVRRQPEPETTSTDPADTTNLNAWKAKHKDWYGVDAEMTKAAHEIDGQIRQAGALEIGSPEYFEAIDRQMRAKFPQKLKGSPSTPSATTPNTDSGRTVRHRIPASVADGYRRMGFDMNDPKVVERLVKGRQSAVEKGILGETPVTGRTIS